jgi:prophage antirepressor-like protein
MEILKALNLYNKDIVVNIQGTHDNPLFQANNIGKLLELINIHDVTKKFSDKYKIYLNTETKGGIQKTMFLTELGLYKVITKSKKKNAEYFQNWVIETIKELRINGNYKINSEKNEIEKNLIKHKCEIEKHKTLIKAYDNKNVVYICKFNKIDDKILIKIGSSQNIKERLNSLKYSFENIEPILIELIDVYNNIKFESFLHKNEYIKDFYYEIKNKVGNSSRETYLVTEKELNEIVKLSNLYKTNFMDLNHDILNRINNIEHIEDNILNKINESNNYKLDGIYSLLLNIKNELPNKNSEININTFKEFYKDNSDDSITSNDISDLSSLNNSINITDEFEEKIKKIKEIEELKLKKEELNLKKEELKLNQIMEWKELKKNEETYKLLDTNDMNFDNISEDSYHSDEDDIDLTTIYFSTKKMSYGIKTPFVYQYSPDNLINPIKIYESPSDVERCPLLEHLEISPSPLRNSFRNNTIYKGFRWYFVKRDEIPPKSIPETIESKHKEPEIKFIAMIDITQSKILNVYPNQKEATKARLMKANSFHRAIKNGTVSSGHYWKYFDECSKDMQDEYLQNNKLPEKYVSSCSKKVEQICPRTKEVLKVYESNREVIKLFKMSVTSLKKYSNSGEIHNGYIWRIC